MPDDLDLKTPSMRGMKGAAFDYATGLGGGVVYELASRYVGRGLIGAAIATVAAASVLKSDKAEIVATVAGFQAAQDSILLDNLMDMAPGQGLLNFNI